MSNSGTFIINQDQYDEAMRKSNDPKKPLKVRQEHRKEAIILRMVLTNSVTQQEFTDMWTAHLTERTQKYHITTQSVINNERKTNRRKTDQKNRLAKKHFEKYGDTLSITITH